MKETPVTRGEEYEVEAVEACRLLSHSDFLTLPQIYTLRSLKTGTRVRLRLPRRLGWRAGDRVTLANSVVLASAV